MNVATFTGKKIYVACYVFHNMILHEWFLGFVIPILANLYLAHEAEVENGTFL